MQRHLWSICAPERSRFVTEEDRYRSDYNSDTVSSSTAQIFVRLGICGLGTGIFISPNNSALRGSAPYQHQGIAADILATARSVGMVLGVGMAGAIFTSVTARGGASGSDASLFSAVQTGRAITAGIAAIGAVTSSLRGSGQNNVKEQV